MRILFIGCVESSYILLKKLIDIGANIVGVITKEISNFNSDFVDLAELCNTNNLDYKYVENINDSKSIEYMKKVKADIVFCFGWSQLIKDEVFNLVPGGIFGFHPTELPNNRGRHPIIWALALGLNKTASTFFKMDKGADTGDIVSQTTIEIEYEDDAATLYEKIMKAAELQVEDIFHLLQTSNMQYMKQSVDEGNSWRKRAKRDGQIDWRMSSRTIYNLVRSLASPYVGAHFMYNNHEYKVWKVKEIKATGYENIEPGKVLEVKLENYFDIKVSDNIIRVLDCDDIAILEGTYL